MRGNMMIIIFLPQQFLVVISTYQNFFLEIIPEAPMIYCDSRNDRYEGKQYNQAGQNQRHNVDTQIFILSVCIRFNFESCVIIVSLMILGGKGTAQDSVVFKPVLTNELTITMKPCNMITCNDWHPTIFSNVLPHITQLHILAA